MPSTRAAPVLRFTLGLLDAQSTAELARTCVHDMVELFDCTWACMRDEERVWAEHRLTPQPDERGAKMQFRISGPTEPRVWLEIEHPKGPDLPIVRQQFLDLMAVARRAFRDRQALSSERRKAHEDPLTGVMNRRGLEGCLEHAMQRARQLREPCSVMMVDLDHFKAVNDVQGHQAGDDVLRLASESFAQYLRPSDTVCRYGGDEFLLICPGLAPLAAAGVAERLRAVFEHHPRARGTTLSIGIAEVLELPPTAGVQSVIELVDASLYEAKRSGRNCYRQASVPQSATG